MVTEFLFWKLTLNQQENTDCEKQLQNSNTKDFLEMLENLEIGLLSLNSFVHQFVKTLMTNIYTTYFIITIDDRSTH